MPETIKFYSITGAFGEFSNFAPYPIRIKGTNYPSTEHYFQSQKFRGTAYEQKIIKSPTPHKAADLGRNRKIKMVPNWDKIRDNVMYTAVLQKFTQHDDLRQLLISTGDAVLIEHTTNDAYWGDGGNGKGKNKLGKILMKVRHKLTTCS